LSAANCANPRFAGSLGSGSSSPPDPLANVTSIGGGGAASGGSGAGGTDAAQGGSAASGSATAGTGSAAAAGAASGAAAGKSGAATKSAGGGSSTFRDALPVAYNRPIPPSPSSLPLLAFVALLALPPVVMGLQRRFGKGGPPA